MLLLRTEDVTQTLFTKAGDVGAERGLVERMRSEEERRAQLVSLTEAGRLLAQDARARSLTMEDEALRALSAAERAILLELLHRVGRSGGE